MTTYYALYPDHDWGLDYCTHVGRTLDGVPQTYDRYDREWVYDRDLFRIYDGSLDSDTITEEQAEYIIERIHTGEAQYAKWCSFYEGLKAGKHGPLSPSEEEAIREFERKKPEKEREIQQRKEEERRLKEAKQQAQQNGGN